jgi:hypothetical protein
VRITADETFQVPRVTVAMRRRALSTEHAPASHSLTPNTSSNASRPLPTSSNQRMREPEGSAPRTMSCADVSRIPPLRPERSGVVLPRMGVMRAMVARAVVL